MNDIRNEFFNEIGKLLEDARKNVKKAANLAMVYSYFEVGRMIVEEEQNGENRAQYGKYILKELAEYLKDNFGKGYSVTNLKQMRQFDSGLYERLALSRDKDKIVQLSQQ